MISASLAAPRTAGSNRLWLLQVVDRKIVRSPRLQADRKIVRSPAFRRKGLVTKPFRPQAGTTKDGERLWADTHRGLLALAGLELAGAAYAISVCRVAVISPRLWLDY